MKKRIVVLTLAMALVLALFAGCKPASDDMMAAIKEFGTEVTRITDETTEVGKLVEKATEVLTSGKPVADVTTTSKLQDVMDKAKENVKFEAPERPASLNAMKEKINELKEIDFSSYITDLKLGIRKVISSQEEYAMNDTLVSKENGVWGVFKSGQLDTSYNGLAMNDLGTWVIKDGKADFSYNGPYDFAGKTYQVKGGKVL